MTSSLTPRALPSAQAPMWSLLTSLARAGWGDLAGRAWAGVRATLQALANLLPYRSAEGKVTLGDVADAAGCSTRWASRCMHVLLDLGVIRWQTGGVVAGVPRPSWVRIVKRRIVDLIELTRPRHEAEQAERRARTREKVKDLRYAYGWHRDGARAERIRRSAQVEVPSTLHLLAEESPTYSVRRGSNGKDTEGAPNGALTVCGSANHTTSATLPPSPPGRPSGRRDGESVVEWARRRAAQAARDESAGEMG